MQRTCRRHPTVTRHFDIYQHDIGVQRHRQGERGLAICHCADHGQVRFGGESHVQALSHGGLLLDDQESDHYQLILCAVILLGYNLRCNVHSIDVHVDFRIWTRGEFYLYF
jgi:hypothetical protein